MDKTLLGLLSKNPWMPYELLEKIFAGTGFKFIYSSKQQQLQEIQIGSQIYVALKSEPIGNLKNIHGINMIRKFIVETFSDEIFTALSPGVEAPLECIIGTEYFRFWYDLGRIPVSALSYIQNPPTAHVNVKDSIILSDPNRIKENIQQISHRWHSEHPVHIFCMDNYKTSKIETLSYRRSHSVFSYSLENLDLVKKKRFSHTEYDNQIGKMIGKLSEEDIDLLIFLGDHPFLTISELSILYGGTAYLSQSKIRSARNKIINTFSRYQEMLGLELIEIGKIKLESYEERVCLSSLGISILANYWGVSEHNMHRFLPWPIQKNDQGTYEYATQWIKKLNDHQTLCRQLIMAIVLRGRSLSSASTMFSGSSKTMIGAKITYMRENSFYETVYEQILPDGIVDLDVYRSNILTSSKSWNLYKPFRLFIEIDNATNSLARIEERLDRYEVIWPEINKEKVGQIIWLTKGSEYWQSELIKMMRKRGLRGYVTTPERLFVDSASDYWIYRPASFSGGGEAEQGMINSFAPYRRIWLSTEGDRFDLEYFLNIEPNQLIHPVNYGNSPAKTVINTGSNSMGAKSFKKGRPKEKRPKLMDEFDPSLY